MGVTSVLATRGKLGPCGAVSPFLGIGEWDRDK
jgi:hypothetical protein